MTPVRPLKLDSVLISAASALAQPAKSRLLLEHTTEMFDKKGPGMPAMQVQSKLGFGL